MLFVLLECKPDTPELQYQLYQTGVASRYANLLHGSMTANGEFYHRDSLTAAHLSLPFGTKIKVENQANCSTIIVTVNDRGPYIGQRILDLSYAAADSLHMIEPGITEVNIYVDVRDSLTLKMN